MNTAEYLDAVKARHHLASDYAAAKFLQIELPAVYKLRKCKQQFRPQDCERVADALGIHPGVVLADMRAQATRNEHERAIWHDVAERMRAVAAVLVLGAGLFVILGDFTYTPDAFAFTSALPVRSPSLCIMSNCIAATIAGCIVLFLLLKRPRPGPKS